MRVVIEVLLPKDRSGELEEKIADYFAFGTPIVWVINPRTRRGYVHTPSGIDQAKDGVLRATDPVIEVPLSAVFAY